MRAQLQRAMAAAGDVELRAATAEAARFFSISRGRRVGLTTEQWRRFECCQDLVANRKLDVLAAACISDAELCKQFVRIDVQDVLAEAVALVTKLIGGMNGGTRF